MARAAIVVAVVVAASLHLVQCGAPAAAGGCPCEDCSDPRLNNASSWALYRLSDVFAHTLSTYDACFWPTSIACDYARRRARLSDSAEFLAAVRRARGARANPALPAADAVVWHLRLGDTVNCTDAFEAPCARNAKYVLQRGYFSAVVDALPTDIRDVTLVYALGHEACKGAADPRHVANSARYASDSARFSFPPRGRQKNGVPLCRWRPRRRTSNRAASASRTARTRTPTTT